MKYFIEIGSNNYDTLYNLCEQGWKGVMVEPVKETFDSLPKHENLLLLNVAIAETEGERDFHIVRSTTAWSSLHSEHHKKVDSNSEAETVKVQCITFDQLMEKCKFPAIDFLKIDAEGYDGTIVKSIDFDKHGIKKLQFEYNHMSVNEWLEIAYMLQRNLFDIVEHDYLNVTLERP